MQARPLSSSVELPRLVKQVRLPHLIDPHCSRFFPVLQFLKLSGFSPIIATASVRNTGFVKAFGATHVVDRTLPASDLVRTIRELAGRPIELVYDAISTVETKELGYDIVAAGGSLILVIPEYIDHYKMPTGKDVRVVEAAGEFSLPENQEFGAKFTIIFEKLLRDAVIKVCAEHVSWTVYSISNVALCSRVSLRSLQVG